MIYILTGDIQTGKSYTLNQWSKNRNDVVGLLCLVKDDGKRDFVNIRTQEAFSMHADSSFDETDKIYVGKFLFSKPAFNKANSIIEFEAKQTDYTFLVVDELGKLELKQKGIYSSTYPVIQTFVANQKKHIILVVRASLLDEIINCYQLKNYQIIDKNAVLNL